MSAKLKKIEVLEDAGINAHRVEIVVIFDNQRFQAVQIGMNSHKAEIVYALRTLAREIERDDDI